MNSLERTPRGEQGFTLIELVVVLAVLGLVLGLVGARLSSGVSPTELKAAAREIASALRETRSQAIVRNRESSLALDVERHTYRIAGRGDKSLPQELRLTLTTARSEQITETAGRVRFYPDGTSTGGRVTISSDQATYYVLVDWLSGRVSVKE
jgi:general secretion pathway protein H